MTKVDKYLHKYLEGTITEPEMQEFRDLLESEPHLQTEMKQILDLRSLVHDDLLELNPPNFLSEGVREMVGERFAALAEEEEKERKRPLFFTERIAGSFVTAMVALVLVALGPSLIAPSGSDTPSAAELALLERPAVTANAAGEIGPENRRGNIPTGVRAADAPAQRAPVRYQAATPANGANSEAGNYGLAEGTQPNVSVPAPVIGPFEEQEMTAQVPSPDESGNAGANMPQLPPRSDLLFTAEAANGGNFSVDPGRSVSAASNRTPAMNGREIPEQSGAIASVLPPSYGAERSASSATPRIAFGFTVGAGGLTNSPSSVALTQGAGYAAVSLSESNRIGIEAGGSKFRYVHTTYSQEVLPLGKSNANAGDAWGAASGGATVAGVYQVYGNGGGGQSGSGSTVPQSRPRTQDPTQITEKEEGPAFFGGRPSPIPQSSTSANTIIRSHTYESDTSMGYGMLFYDRRVVSLNDELNIRSRVGVGGTDGGLIFDIRAYAAFATNENVAITLGVGGSALRELSHEGKLSANYGVQVGAELGF